jgi:hypothetical protein
MGNHSTTALRLESSLGSCERSHRHAQKIFIGSRSLASRIQSLSPHLTPTGHHPHTTRLSLFSFHLVDALSLSLSGSQYDKALETYLEIEPNELRKVHSTDMRDDSFDEQATGDKAQNTKNHNFQYVFDLIEKQVFLLAPPPPPVSP